MHAAEQHVGCAESIANQHSDLTVSGGCSSVIILVMVTSALHHLWPPPLVHEAKQHVGRAEF